MKMTFRWYGEEDPVTLAAIRQIPGDKMDSTSCNPGKQYTIWGKVYILPLFTCFLYVFKCIITNYYMKHAC